MSAKPERIYWLYQQLTGNRYPSRSGYCRRYEVTASSFKRDLEFLRHRLLAPIAYDRRHNGYRLTEESFELPSYWFNPPALLFLAAACNQLRHLKGGSFGGLAEKIENLLRLQGKSTPLAFKKTACINERMNLQYRPVTHRISNNTPHASRQICAPWGVTFSRG